MPASVCEPVSNALRASLAGSGISGDAEGGLDGRLLGAARGTLLSEIEFEAAGDYQSSLLDSLKSKYAVIRPRLPPSKLGAVSGCSGSTSTENKRSSGLPRPSRVLFPLENVYLGWSPDRSWSVGAGMQNVGNTCYLNSTLQALFHVPAFANWLISDSHHWNECQRTDSCVICAMRATLLSTQETSVPIKPWRVYSKLRLICRDLTPGRQEDAHEFLRHLVDAMERCYLSRFPGSKMLDRFSRETTPLNQILGGYLKSTVRCLACQHLSITYEHFQDLTLDIRKHDTLEEALDSFFSRERLEDLCYTCEACNKKVSATKQFFIERCPSVLCITLKRFSYMGPKFSKHIKFRKRIHLDKYTQKPVSYRLVGMVTHLGSSQNCGHYTAVGQAADGRFYQFDDSCVKMLPLGAVMSTNAYLMFYERERATPEETVVSGQTQTQQTATKSDDSSWSVVYGPQLPKQVDNIVQNRDKSPIKMTFKLYSMDRNQKTLTLNGTMKSETKNGENGVKQNGEGSKTTNGTAAKESNGTKEGAVAKLVQYDSDGEEEKPETSAKSTQQSWTVSSENRRPLLSPSLNGVVNNKIKEKESDREKSPNTSTSTLSSPGSPEQPDRSPTDAAKSAESKPNRAPHLPKPEFCGGQKPQSGGFVSTKATNGPCGPPKLQNGSYGPPKPQNGSYGPPKPQSGSYGLPKLQNGSYGPPKLQNGSYGSSITQNGELVARHETLHKLQHMSHRGYGAPVSTWNGTQSNMGRQVYEERRQERKRAHDALDEMDAGRHKKVKRFNHNSSRFYNNYHRPHHYNPFQEKQNKQSWGGERRYHNQHQYNKPFNKYRRFNNHRYNNHRSTAY